MYINGIIYLSGSRLSCEGPGGPGRLVGCHQLERPVDEPEEALTEARSSRLGRRGHWQA